MLSPHSAGDMSGSTLHPYPVLAPAGSDTGSKAFVMDALSVPCFLLNLAGTVVYANRSAYEHLKYDSNELIGIHITGLDAAFSDALWKDLCAMIVEDSSLKYESHISTKTAHAIPYEFHFQYFERGAEKFICALAFNITDRKDMEADMIAAREAALESAIELREKTRLVEEALKKVNALKLKQDGDYYLTSMLLQPFQVNRSQSAAVQVDWLVRQKTQFTYKKWNAEIGGDLCLSDSISLMNRHFTFFVAADAMGKANQGACGALILATIVRTYVERTKKSSQMNQAYPERWLKLLHSELQAGFAGFEGLMMISAFIGLVDEASGWMYFFNSEQPQLVSYRNGKARYVCRENPCEKIGLPLSQEGIIIDLYEIQPREVMVIGSDGRDDIRISGDAISDDPAMFLRHVEEAGADLQRIWQNTLKTGEVIDDFSLLSIQLKEPTVNTPRNDEVDRLMERYYRLKDISALKQALELRENHIPALAALSNRYIKNGNIELSTLYLSRYSDLVPKDLKAIYALGTQFCRLEQYERAIDVLERITSRCAEAEEKILVRKILGLLAGLYKKLKNPREQTIRSLMPK
jgi:Stage II sporulation protein E (SpoIIE)